MNAQEYLKRSTFRTKKWRQVTEQSIYGFSPCSNGSSTLQPTDVPPASRAPRLANAYFPVPVTGTVAYCFGDRLLALLFAVFAGGALALALIGIYGVMAFLVQTRTHEIGVRMALGATARDVFKLIVGRGMKLTALGIVIGAGRSSSGDALDAQSAIQYEHDRSDHVRSDFVPAVVSGVSCVLYPRTAGGEGRPADSVAIRVRSLWLFFKFLQRLDSAGVTRI